MQASGRPAPLPRPAPLASCHVPLQCKLPTSANAACKQASGDPYCLRCDGVRCCACWQWRRVQWMLQACSCRPVVTASPHRPHGRGVPPCPHHAQTYDAPAWLPCPPRCLQIYCIQCQPGYQFNDAYKVRASNAAALPEGLPPPRLARALQSSQLVGGRGCVGAGGLLCRELKGNAAAFANSSYSPSSGSVGSCVTSVHRCPPPSLLCCSASSHLGTPSRAANSAARTRRAKSALLVGYYALAPAAHGLAPAAAHTAPRLPILLADGACTLCTNQYHVLTPLNAIFINAAGQGSQVHLVSPGFLPVVLLFPAGSRWIAAGASPACQAAVLPLDASRCRGGAGAAACCPWLSCLAGYSGTAALSGHTQRLSVVSGSSAVHDCGQR